MMRIATGFLLLAAFAARGSDVYRYEVKRGSELEKELGYTLSVQDQNDEKRSEGMDTVIPIEGVGNAGGAEGNGPGVNRGRIIQLVPDSTGLVPDRPTVPGGKRSGHCSARVYEPPAQ